MPSIHYHLFCTIRNMVACNRIILFLLLLLQVSVIVCKEDDGIIITLHRNEKSDLPAGLVQEDQEYEKIAMIVEATKNRARALKLGIHRGQVGNNKSVSESLYARSYGGYSIKFSLGTPPQDLSLIMDTGSDLVWVPCTQNYTCIDCSANNTNSNGLFLPRMSSSLELLTCDDPNCKSFYGKSTEGLCGNCSGSPAQNCSQNPCPAYEIGYGRGSTEGLLLSETLTLPLEDERQAIKHLVVGCSIISMDEPSGIAGFGRGALSMPSQLSDQHIIGEDIFAYCLQSHRFDDENKKSVMLLGDKALPEDIPLNYTPFLINSRALSSPYGSLYYIGLIGVSIGGKRLNLPSKLLRFDTKGNGGTIIDSGTTFTVFNEEIYEKISAGFASQIGYRRATEVEATTRLGLCYNVSGIENVLLPDFAFNFMGGSDMVLPVTNYFSYANSLDDSICLTMMSSEVDNGPAVILGNYQQQNFYILYDREKNRLGSNQQTCKTFGLLHFPHIPIAPPEEMARLLHFDFFFILCISIAHSWAAVTPADNYLIDCEATNVVNLDDGRRFETEGESSSFLTTLFDDQSITVSTSNATVPSALYMTARVITERRASTGYIFISIPSLIKPMISNLQFSLLQQTISFYSMISHILYSMILSANL